MKVIKIFQSEKELQTRNHLHAIGKDNNSVKLSGKRDTPETNGHSKFEENPPKALLFERKRSTDEQTDGQTKFWRRI